MFIISLEPQTPKVILPGLKWFNVERPAGLLVNAPHMQVRRRCYSPWAGSLLSREGPTPDLAYFTRSNMALPSYVVHPLRTLRNSHTLSNHCRLLQILILPLSIVQWNRLQAHIARLPTFEESVHSQSPNAINVSV